MKELLFEIGCEEIPASFVPPALAEMKRLFETAAQSVQLPHGAIRTLGTPRRLVLVVEGIPARQEDRQERKLGPAVKAAFDEQGNPTRALLGFAKSQGVDVSQLERITVESPKKGEYFGYTRTIPGRDAKELLSEILQGLIPKIPFRKTMRWGACRERFARPVHWICALFGGEVVKVSFGEPGSAEYIESGAKSYGHRFHSPTPFSPKDFADYLDRARTGMVLVDPEERKETIRKGLEALAREANARLISDEDLLEEVTWLVEFPVPILGSFDKAFLEIPREVLITSMRSHQRFFALEDPQTGKLVPHFLTIAGTVPKDASVVRAGNERVLKARLSDAAFFFREDQKKRLEEHALGLEQVTFQAKLGSYARKVARVCALVPELSEVVAPGDAKVLQTAERAALLSKADLLTGMVGEFPELQGIMGREYGLRQGEPKEVCQAIEEHYMPRGENDELPKSPAGAVCSLADKLDSVVSLYAVGLGPSAAKDFYAVRRQALGVLKIILDRRLPLKISAVTRTVARLLEEEGVEISFESTLLSEDPRKKLRITTVDGLAQEIGEFFRGRLRGILEEEGVRVDLINAVLELRLDDMVDSADRARALNGFASHPRFEDFCDLAKRVRNICRGAKDEEDRKIADRERDPQGGFVYPNLGEVDPGLFRHDAEPVMFREFNNAREKLPRALKARDYTAALDCLKDLIEPVDQFMNHGPLVLDEDPLLRRNRITLCAGLDRLISSFADFSKVQAKREE